VGLEGPIVKDEQGRDHGRMEMSEVIRRRRAELGLSQADLAAAAGVGARQIRRYEAGEQQPVLSAAAAIADALGISVNELASNSRARVVEGSAISVVDAVMADPHLDDGGRELLTTVYRWLIRQRQDRSAKS
jgi:transcriptional regulator with XRE-family HTH domain